ncbi:MAG: hypothetical protein ACLFPN_02975 [Methanomassiliicoccales archaeon]
MIPDHCKDVSVRKVDFPLTREEIERSMSGRKAYTRTDHLVLVNGEEVSVVRVWKEENRKALFKPIVDFEILSLPHETVMVRDEGIDVLNPSHMARLADRHPGKLVVVEGLFNHVSFIKDIEPIRLRVLDTVPPYPAKMGFLVEKALSSGHVDLPIIPVEETVDLNELARGVSTEGVIFPCRASRMTSEKRTFFLDEFPEIDVEAELIGCPLSQRIYRSLYKEDKEIVNICPWDLAPRDGVPTIVKCCRVKEGYQIDDNVIVVQWGASVREVTEAINGFFSEAQRDLPSAKER